MSFKGHVQSLCKKASQKLHALSRISNYVNDKQLKLTMRVFILSQFSYCPLIWMFYDRQTNNRINRIHKKSLRLALAYDDYQSNFQSLLEKTTRRQTMIKICSCFLQKYIKLYLISTQVSCKKSLLKEIQAIILETYHKCRYQNQLEILME